MKLLPKYITCKFQIIWSFLDCHIAKNRFLYFYIEMVPKWLETHFEVQEDFQHSLSNIKQMNLAVHLHLSDIPIQDLSVIFIKNVFIENPFPRWFVSKNNKLRTKPNFW